jgi:hypothetical protein
MIGKPLLPHLETFRRQITKKHKTEIRDWLAVTAASGNISETIAMSLSGAPNSQTLSSSMQPYASHLAQKGGRTDPAVFYTLSRYELPNETCKSVDVSNGKDET